MKLDGSRSRSRRMKTILISLRELKRSSLNFVLHLTRKLSNDPDFLRQLARSLRGSRLQASLPRSDILLLRAMLSSSRILLFLTPLRALSVSLTRFPIFPQNLARLYHYYRVPAAICRLDDSRLSPNSRLGTEY